MFVGPCPYMDRDYCIRSNFWKFYLIKTSLFGECVLTVNWNIFFGVQTIDRRTTSYLLAGPVCL